MGRTVKMAVCATAMAVAMSGLALAQYGRDDYGYYGQGNVSQARQYGYQNGYNDGVSKGRHEGRERDPYDYQTPDWRQASRGYQRWMGEISWYQRGYQEGYSNGFRSGYRSIAGWRGDRDRWRFNGSRGYDPYPASYQGVAYQFGYEDGAAVARADIQNGKPYNSRPRGRFDDCDRGYRREYGSKDQYKAEYASAYSSGYDAVMGRRY